MYNIPTRIFTDLYLKSKRQHFRVFVYKSNLQARSSLYANTQLRAHRRAEKYKDKKKKIRNNKNFKKCGKQSLVVLFVKIQCHKNYGSATAERSFSVLRRLKTYVRLIMNNDRLSSLALMHIYRDFSVDLDKVMEKCVSAKTRRTDFWQF